MTHLYTLCVQVPKYIFVLYVLDLIPIIERACLTLHDNILRYIYRSWTSVI